MKFAFAFLAGLFVVALPAAAQIERPRLGYVLDSRGDLRPVMGEPASAALGDPVGVVAISFACSLKLCLAKTDAAVVAFIPDRRGRQQGVAASPAFVTPCATCAGPALIALDDPASTTGVPGAWIYFQTAHQLARWHEGILDAIDFAPGGVVLSLRATTGGFDYAVARGRVGRKAGVVWIEHYSASDGRITVIVDSAAVLDSPGATRAVMLFDGGILLAARDHVILRRPDGREMTFPLAGPKRFQAAGNGYVEIAVPNGLWLLRTDPGREQLVLLPGVHE
ncbi:MAG TPA: hypothetical protein VGR73_22320 [Bryobacteraceae bacterium]|nr:hypothetical protein [Bryobacteraceae bacterium]